jgi:very-short-patch-repair endonuclease
MSHLEEILALHLRAAGLPSPEREVRFHPARLWRLDFAWPSHMLALEVEGGVHGRGRHVRPQGFEGDCEKYNEAALLGWTVLRVTGKMVRDGRALGLVERAIEQADKYVEVSVMEDVA